MQKKNKKKSPLLFFTLHREKKKLPGQWRCMRVCSGFTTASKFVQSEKDSNPNTLHCPFIIASDLISGLNVAHFTPPYRIHTRGLVTRACCHSTPRSQEVICRGVISRIEAEYLTISYLAKLTEEVTRGHQHLDAAPEIILGHDHFVNTLVIPCCNYNQ